MIYWMQLNPTSPGKCHLKSSPSTKFIILTIKQYQSLEYHHLQELYLYPEFPFLLPSFFFSDVSEEDLENKVLEIRVVFLVNAVTKLYIKEAYDLISRLVKMYRFIKKNFFGSVLTHPFLQAQTATIEKHRENVVIATQEGYRT